MTSIREALSTKNVQPEVKNLLTDHQRRVTKDNKKTQNTSKAALTGNKKPMNTNRVYDPLSHRKQDNRNSGHNNHRHNQRFQRNERTVFFQDGIDHINIWSRGETPLGRALSMESPINVKTPYGNFPNIYALWVFLTTKNHPKQIATWTDSQLRHWVRCREDLDKYTPGLNVMYICAQALVDYIKANPAIALSLVETGDAPFDSYVLHSVHGKFPHQHCEWWVSVVRLIRSQLQAGMGMNVSSFLEDESTPYPDIRPESLPRLGEIKTDYPVKEDPVATKVDKPSVTDEIREKIRQANNQMQEQLRQELASREPDHVLSFDSPDLRQAAMREIILTGDTTVQAGQPDSLFKLYIWLNDEKSVETLSTDIFENPLDAAERTPSVLIEDSDNTLTVIRQELKIAEYVPDDSIQVCVLKRRNKKVTKGTDELVIREDVFSNEGTPNEESVQVTEQV